ncbi:MAG: hypothetical protein Q9169_004390 [Polycauliona sp. 2 TL-2023]
MTWSVYLNDILSSKPSKEAMKHLKTIRNRVSLTAAPPPYQSVSLVKAAAESRLAVRVVDIEEKQPALKDLAACPAREDQPENLTPTALPPLHSLGYASLDDGWLGSTKYQMISPSPSFEDPLLERPSSLRPPCLLNPISDSPPSLSRSSIQRR